MSIKDYKYFAKIRINGIYGEVNIFRDFGIIKKDELKHAEESICKELNQNRNDVSSEYINYNYELRNEFNETVFCSDIIEGLPPRITQDTYFKIALVQNLKDIIKDNKSNNKELLNTIILASGGNVIKK